MKDFYKKTEVQKTLSVLCCLFLANWLLAQQVTDQWKQIMQLPGNNYFEIKAQAEAYFEAHPELVGQQGTGWKDYQRLKWFMEPRVDINGSLATANAALIDWFQNQTNYCPASSLTSNWSLLGPITTPSAIGTFAGNSPTGMGMIISLYIKPANSNIMFAGSSTGGLWKTTNGGQTWVPLTPFTTGNKLPGIGVTSIAVHPTNDNLIYIATGSESAGRKYGMGILKTTDGGNTWSIIGPISIIPSDEVLVLSMAMHPTNPDILYATTAKQTGWCCGGSHVYEARIYKTTDAGNTWTELQLIPSSRFWDIEFKPGDPNTVLIGGESLWRTTDGGANWTDLTPNLQLPQSNLKPRIALSFADITNPNKVFLLYAMHDSPTAGIMRSDNSGNSWTLINTYSTATGPLRGAGSYKCELIVSPSNPDILYTGAIRMAKSSDGGNSLSIISNPNLASSQYKHDDIRELQIVTISGNERVYTGNDGGVGVSTNGGSSWTNISGSGLSVTQFYGIGGFDGGPVGGGCQDVSTMIYRNNAWGNTSSLYCDGGDMLIDYSNPDKLFCNCNSGLQISTNGGTNFQSVNELIGPMEIHPTNPQILWKGWDNVAKTTNGGTTWPDISDLGNANITALAVAPSNPDVIYFSAGGPTINPPVEKRFFKTTDGGADAVISWTDISVNVIVDGSQILQWFGITSIVVHPNNPDKIWISLGGVGGGFNSTYRVCTSSNGGATWSNISTGLPGLPISKLAYQNGTNDILYAATDVGVFVLNPSSNQWECFSTNLPAAIISDLEIDYCSGKLRASTYGWGMWESNLAVSTNLNPSSFQTRIVNTNTTFPTTLYLNSNLTIQNNSTLTASNLYMPQKSKIIVQQGCSLIVQNTIASRCSGDFWDGIIEVQPGGTLVLGNNSTIKLGGNGKIIIDKNLQIGRIVINPGANLILKDNSTVLEITGGVWVLPNATFTFTGNGYIDWKSGNTTTFGNGSKFLLNGSGKTDLLMKLENAAIVNISAPIDIQNGKIEYGTNASFNGSNATVLLMNLNFSGNASATGFYGNGVTSFRIQSSDLSDFNKGVFLENISPLNSALVLSCTFSNCSTSVKGNGLDLIQILGTNVQNSFTDYASVLGYDFSNTRNVNASGNQISNCEKAVQLNAVQGFYMSGGKFQNNKWGIHANNSLIFMRNGAVIDNSEWYGIEIIGFAPTIQKPMYRSMVTMGDVGCGSITNSLYNAIIGENALMNIDAVQHAINRGTPNDVRPNNFYGNNLMLDLCYNSPDAVLIPNQVLAKGNFWRTVGSPNSPSGGSSLPSMFNVNKTNGTSCTQNIPVDASCHSTCFYSQIQNSCMNCQANSLCQQGSGGNGGNGGGGGIKPPAGSPEECPAKIRIGGGGGKTIDHSFRDANNLFLMEDINTTRSNFKEISDLKLSKDNAGDIIICDMNDPSCGNGGGGKPGEKISNPCAQLVMVSKVLYEGAAPMQQRKANPEDTQQEIFQKEILQSEIFNLKSEITIYPNPNDGTMTIAYSLPEGENGKFVIFDVTGRKISEFKMLSENKHLIISERKLGTGIFYYQFTVDDNSVKTGKLIVLK